jgi:hypothetical protein
VKLFGKRIDKCNIDQTPLEKHFSPPKEELFKTQDLRRKQTAQLPSTPPPPSTQRPSQSRYQLPLAQQAQNPDHFLPPTDPTVIDSP